MRRRRSSGILLSLTSLPSEFGIGGLGPGAYRFADFLQASGQRLWQFLPIHPTTVARGNSPYDAESFFAASTLLIGLTPLIEEGLISADVASPIVRILGPAECPVFRLNNFYRFHFQVQSADSGVLHDVLRTVLTVAKPPANVEFQVDVDPFNML